MDIAAWARVTPDGILEGNGACPFCKCEIANINSWVRHRTRCITRALSACHVNDSGMSSGEPVVRDAAIAQALRDRELKIIPYPELDPVSALRLCEGGSSSSAPVTKLSEDMIWDDDLPVSEITKKRLTNQILRLYAQSM